MVTLYIVPLVLFILALIGLLNYFRAPDTRGNEVGRIIFFCSFFMLLFWLVTQFHPGK